MTWMEIAAEGPATPATRDRDARWRGAGCATPLAGRDHREGGQVIGSRASADVIA